MFNLRDYILKLLDESIGKEPDYKVRENALKWYERGTLVEADLEAIDQLIEERKKSSAEQIQEETSSIEETQEENGENSDENQESAEPLF